MWKAPTIEPVPCDIIVVGPRHRQTRRDAVDALADSIRDIGLKTPITVRELSDDGDVELIAGAHRLAAAKRLGWERIDCFVLRCDAVEAEKWQIAENLHRAELTTLERDQHVARWVELVSAPQVSSQSATKPEGGRPESGVRKAARELNIPKDDAHRAVKVASLSDEAKEAARETGLDDNRTVLLKAAKADPDEQADVIHFEAARRAQKPDPAKDAENASMRWRMQFQDAFAKKMDAAPSAGDQAWAVSWVNQTFNSNSSVNA